MRPTLRLRPKVVSGVDRLGRPVERVGVEAGFGYPPEIQSLVEALKEACEGGSVARQCEAFYTLASSLLRRAHEVSLSTACELLSVSEDDVPRLVEDVVSVVTEMKDTPEVV